jgi:hypothetical protein
VISFAQALAPLGREEFLADYWGQNYLRVPGEPGKFSALMNWCELERLLEEQRFHGTRLRLFQNGKALPPEQFLIEQPLGPVVNAAGLLNALSAGASLVLSGVQGSFPGIRAFADSLEAELQLHTWVNLYAGWRTQQAFDLHWDDHNTLILQVAGRKRWQVFRPTVWHPLKEMPGDPAARPTEPPVWEGVLEEGDLLYMPRGWWHMACPLDEPSLHLTFSNDPGHGTGLLKWLAGQLSAHAEVRRDLPHLAGPAAQQQYLARVRELVAEALQGEVIERYLASTQTLCAPRPEVSLARLNAGRGVSLSPLTKVRLTTARRLAFEGLAKNTGGIVRFRAGDKWMQCAGGLVPALQGLGTVPVAVAELGRRLPDPAAMAQLTLLLASLLAAGVLAVEPGADPTA